MVNGAFAMIAVSDPERRLALTYAPAEARAGLAALWALDEALGRILRTTQQPLVAQMRLAWWREALAALDDAPPPAEPVLQALALDVLPKEVRGAGLASQPDAWEYLLAEDLTDDALGAYAKKRGELFVMAAHLLGATRADLPQAGAAWALGDFARHARDPKLATQARALIAVPTGHWPRRLRTLGALAKTARHDVTPWRIPRMAWHALTGL